MRTTILKGLLVLSNIISAHFFSAEGQEPAAENQQKIDLPVSFPLIGNVKPRLANTIDSSNWIIGCETLDRDFADYDATKFKGV